MRDFEANTDFVCILTENPLIGDNDKPGGIILELVNSLLQNLQSVNLCRICTCHGSLTAILLICNLFCRKRIVLHTDQLPIVFLQIL